MKNLVKYLAFLPLLLIQYSCDDTASESNMYNGDLIGSWMLTDLVGTYVYTVSLPDETWPADTTFGMKVRWDMADAIFTGALSQYSYLGDIWLSEVSASDTIPGVSTTAIFNIDSLKQDSIGLIGYFQDAASSGGPATYRMGGVYPGIFYDYSGCATGTGTVSGKADMGDQGVYYYDQTKTSGNFQIERDPAISGSQVLPPFNDGTIGFLDTTLNILNIKFRDRDSHSSLYTEIPDYQWNEGAHPSVNNLNSGGDRTYMAFPPVLAVADLGYGDTFVGEYDGTNGTPGAGPAYVYNPALTPWSNYMTYNALCFNTEMGALAGQGVLTDANSDGTMADDLVGYMLNALAADPTKATHGLNMPYAKLVSMGTDGQTPTIIDDSDHDLGSDASLGGRLKYTLVSDCAVPADVTIDFDATFSRCINDFCIGDGYHISPSWD